MKAFKLLAVAALLVGLVGCDTTDFSEDFPDPEAEGLPPYVAFDTGQLQSAGFAYAAAQDELGSRRTVGAARTAANFSGLRVRLPVALEEDVTVTYELGGNAEYGVDYRLFVFDPNAGDSGAWVENAPSGNTGSITILYNVEEFDSANLAPNYRDLRVTVPGSTDRAQARTMSITLTGVSSPSQREITVGRLPNNRDTRATFTIGSLIAADLVCPDTLQVGEEGTFTASLPYVPTGAVSGASWDFGDGEGEATGFEATYTYTEAPEMVEAEDEDGNPILDEDGNPVMVPGSYQVVFSVDAAGPPASSATVSCDVVVIGDDEDDDDGDGDGND